MLPDTRLPLGTVPEAAILDGHRSREAGVGAEVFRDGLVRAVRLDDDAVNGSNLQCELFSSFSDLLTFNKLLSSIPFSEVKTHFSFGDSNPDDLNEVAFEAVY